MLSLVAFFMVALMSFTNNINPGMTGDGYKVGDVATDFFLKGVDGKMVSLADYKDAKGYIVIFTCNHCPYSKMYEDRIIEIHNKYAPQGYPVIAINPNNPEIQPDDSYEKMQVRAKEKNFPFAYVFDADQSIFPKYGATKTPHVFLLDNKKVVQYIGAIDDNARSEEDVEETFLEDAIISLQMGEKVDPSYTKAVGCSIKS